MDHIDRKTHWNKIYRIRKADELSWYQSAPSFSLELVTNFELSRDAKIIDIGGGDSLFVDHLLNLGYQDITVLDISENAIDRAKFRLGDKSDKVKWIIADAAEFIPTEKYDLWHDRATFHFLTDEEEIGKYLRNVITNIKPTGCLVIGTFSEQGPEKCSGLTVRQYSEQTMTELLKAYFTKEKCIQIDHNTPSGSIQNFIFCSFRRNPDDR